MNVLQQKPKAPDSSSEKSEQSAPSLSAMPSADQYASASRARAYWFLIGGGVLGALAAASFVGFGLDNIFLPITLLVSVLMPILIWRFPRFIVYLTLAAACLFELGQVRGPDGQFYKDGITDRVPFFWNVNTIFQNYAHVNFKGIPLNLFEVLIVIAGVCSCLRAVYTQTTSLRPGPLLLPVGVYMGFVIMGWGNGIMTGGDFKISLLEVRSQLYFGLAYLMTFNLIRERKHLLTFFWIMVPCIALKAILLTFRRYVTMHGQLLPDQGVGAHEDAFFMDAFMMLLVALSLCKVLPRLRWFMWSMMPFVVLGNLVLNRRAATAALVLLVPLMLMAAYQALPQRRRMVLALGLVITVSFSIYYPLFKNSDSIFAQPARAVKSNFEPDARDASSNASRDAENFDLMATIKSAPLQGYGFGRPFFEVMSMADVINVYDLEPYIPHNQILWIWERVGTFGFLSFWMMISSIIIYAGQTIRRTDVDDLTRAVGIFAMLVIAMLVIFGLLDLQLSNPRDVLFAALWTGAMAAAPTLRTSTPRDGRDAP